MPRSTPRDYVNQEFSTFLRQRRRELDLTRNELARRVGCSPDTIKKMEEGERRPSKELAELLAENLQIDLVMRASFIHMARARGPVTHDIAPSNMPAPLTSFIGRASEVSHIESLLRKGNVRLLTLVGPPGVGKSRLSLYAAEQMRDHFADGVWFVSLVDIEEPQQVLVHIAKTLEIGEETGGTPLDWLVANLRHRHILLVLDNFEQVVDAAPSITALLTACAQLCAIITSRTPLEVYGEHQLVVQPLPVPPASLWNSPDALQSYEALQLFVARIRAHNLAFQLTAENSAALAELCVRLDGIPLAIELAAGLTRAESPRLLLEDIEREGRLALLTTAQRDRVARQQTLREAIAWSVRRLSLADQMLFARLSVFHGTFDFAASYAVAGVSEQEAPQQPVSNDDMPIAEYRTRLQALAASHLVQLQAGKDTPRYRLLETLREYGLEMLQHAGAFSGAQRRHAEHYATVVYAIDPAQTVGNLHQWRDLLRPDYSNLLAALQFALSIEDVELTLKLASGLGQYWYLEGSWQEGAHWLAQALALSGGSPSARARAKSELGILYSALGRYPEAESYLNEARDEATQAGELMTTAWILAQLGHIALLQGQVTVTRAHTLERLQIYRQIGDIRYLALTLEQIGTASVEEGDYERGMPWLEECLTLWEKQRARAGVAAIRLVIGMAELAQGQASSALARFQLAYDDFAAIEHSHGLPWSLRNLGLAHIALGQVPQAQLALHHALERYLALTSHEGPTAVVVEAIAGIATRIGQHHLAANLMGAAAISRQHGMLPLTENSRQIYERMLAPSIKAIGQVEWDQANAVGAALPWPEAVDTARSLLTPHPIPQRKVSTAP